MKKRVALLGCGVMGTRIALAIDSGEIPAVLTHVYDSSERASGELLGKLRCKPAVARNAHLLSSNPVDIVVEAASQDAVRDVALSVLQNRKDLMIMSAGALLDESVHDILAEACRDFKKTILLPSGAIAGLDALRSVGSGLSHVAITTTKHPRSLRGARFFETSEIDLDSLTEPTVVFDGSAADAVSLFPANVNVSALLSLSGTGGDSTAVRVVADPNTSHNTHTIDAKGEFGEVSITVRNLPDPANPKTSRLAILSAIQTLKEYCSGGIRVGT